MAHGLVHFAAVAKAHFNLGGVNVHVHPRGVHGQVQGVDRLAVPMQHVFKGAAGRMGKHFVAHKTAVHITKLLVCATACRIGHAHPAPDPHRRLTVLAR